jgi:hypothetical protein
MRVIILFFGLLGLFLFSNEGMINQKNDQSYAGVNSSFYFENSQPISFNDSAYPKSILFLSSEDPLSIKKSRQAESNCKFHDLAQWLGLSVQNQLASSESVINLFLIFHFSLSLWQVFLQ